MVDSVRENDTLASLNNDLFYKILGAVDGTTLATAACACSALRSISKEETLWENVCSSLWPSTKGEDVKNLICSIGGFRKFYADCFPTVLNKEVSQFQCKDFLEYPEEWTEAEYYGDMDDLKIISPSDFVSIVDIIYKDKTICSKVIWDINGINGWFYDYPFCVDFLTYSSRDEDGEGEVSISVSDGIPPILWMEGERKSGKFWHELCDEIHLSWIVVNRRTRQAANLSSWIPLGGQRHWPTDKDFILHFGTVLPAKEILYYQVVKCTLTMKFRAICADGESIQTLKLKELSMQFEDMDGLRVNGRNSLLILKEALSSKRSKSYDEVLESCRLFTKVQSELKEEKMRNENRLDRIFIFSGLLVFASFWYCVF